MRHIVISGLLPVLLLGSGCSVAKTAMSALSPSKPQPVTVVNNVQVAAPQPQTVVVVHEEKKHGKSFMEKVGIVTTSTIVGAAAGALVGEATDSDVGTTTFLGAGLGAFTGLAVAKD